MARNLTASLILAAAAWIAATGTGRAQTLQRLTVESFVLSADTMQPQVDVPFHVIVTLRVRESVSEITNLQLPMLAQLDLLGDERQTVSDPRGTQYREVVTVVAHSDGRIMIAPATLQAIDARDGKPKQWFTNDLPISVHSSASHIANGMAAGLVAHVARILAALIWLALLVGAALLAIFLLRRRAPVAPVASVPVSYQPAPVLSEAEQRRQQIADALLVLRAERTRSAAVRVRGAVWRAIGASEGETLADVLRRPGCGQGVLRDLLVALERSAFTYDEDLPGAIDDACAALERYAGSLT
ncbi:MAG TPA: hypothetical protein VKR56_12540 [Candidatus Cybelea sp.]|nr:hypothetical protein [Candidatus Cybelea sp.]